MQCVQPWAKDKSHYLHNYIEATKKVRARYLPPPAARGGAAFVDLFAGPGKKRIGESNEIILGSPLVALEHREAPFTRVIACDIDPENVASLRARTSGTGRCDVLEGDCNRRVADIVRLIPEEGLNLAFIDPFGLQHLKFSTIATLGRIHRMDLLIHFPTGDIKRNLVADPARTGKWLDEALGTDSWRSCPLDRGVDALVGVLIEQLKEHRYTGTRFHAPAIKTLTDVPLYHLVFASRHRLGDKIWASIIRTDPSGQTSLPLQ